MKVYCAADLHLGRIPSRLPADLPVAEADLGPTAAWRRLVDACLADDADALLLAGDLVDDDRDLFAAYGDLERELRRLEHAGIPVIAVAGNHDVRSLPRLARALPNLRVLGQAGSWEAVDLEAGTRTVRVVGWSFPAEHVGDSPLAAPGRERVTPGPDVTIGLLHADLDASASRYAPVSRRDLDATGLDAWLLGHVHVPSDFASETTTGYLGSLAAADPGETGPRGAWRLTIEGSELRFERRAIAPLVYETVEIDVSGASADDVLGLVAEGLERAVFDDRDARVTGVRLRVTGSVANPTGVRAALKLDDERAWILERGERAAFVHALEVAVVAPHDLERLATLDDPIGVAARTLRTLRDPAAPERADLLAAARTRLVGAERRSAFRGLDLPFPDDEALAQRLERIAGEVLDALIASREDGRP